jgi:hypothetical protein
MPRARHSSLVCKCCAATRSALRMTEWTRNCVQLQQGHPAQVAPPR